MSSSSSRKRRREEDAIMTSSPFEMIPEAVMHLIYQYISSTTETNAAASIVQHFGFLCKSCFKDCIEYLRKKGHVYYFKNDISFSAFVHNDMMNFMLLHKIKISHLVMEGIDSFSWMWKIIRNIVQQCDIGEMKALTMTYKKQELLEMKTKSNLVTAEEKNHKRMAMILERKTPSLQRVTMDCLVTQGHSLVQRFSSSLVHLHLNLLEGMKTPTEFTTAIRQCKKLKDFTLKSICKHYCENYIIHSQSLEKLSIHLDRDMLPMEFSMDIMCPSLKTFHVVSYFCSFQYGRFELPSLQELYVEQREFKRANTNFQQFISALVNDDSCPNLHSLGLCCKIENWSLRIQSNSLVEIHTNFDDAEKPYQVQYDCPSLQHLHGYAKLMSRENRTTKLDSTCLPTLEEISKDKMNVFQCTAALDITISDELVNGNCHLPINCIVHLRKRESSLRYSIW